MKNEYRSKIPTPFIKKHKYFKKSLKSYLKCENVVDRKIDRKQNPAKVSPIFINTLYICDDRLDVAVLFALERVPDRALNSALSRRSPGFSLSLSFSVGFTDVSVGYRRMSRMNRPIAAGLAHTSKRGKRTLCTVEWGTELRAQSAFDDNAARYYARFAVTRAIPQNASVSRSGLIKLSGPSRLSCSQSSAKYFSTTISRIQIFIRSISIQYLFVILCFYSLIQNYLERVIFINIYSKNNNNTNLLMGYVYNWYIPFVCNQNNIEYLNYTKDKIAYDS